MLMIDGVFFFLQTIYSLLSKKPEQERRLLSVLVNKVSPNFKVKHLVRRKIICYRSFFLNILILVVCKMKNVSANMCLFFCVKLHCPVHSSVKLIEFYFI